MKLKKVDVFIGALLFISSLSFYLHYSTPILWSPDEMNYYTASKRFIECGDNNIINPMNIKYDTNIFNYGFSVFKSPSEEYPGIFSGSVLIYSITMALFGDTAFFWMAPIFGAIGVITIYLITKNILMSRYLGIFAALSLFTMPIWIRWSTEHYTNVIMTTIFLLSFLSLIDLNGNIRYLMSGMFLSAAILIRLPVLLLSIPFLLFIITEPGEKIKKIKNLTLFFIPIIFVLLVILPILNMIMYNDPFFIPVSYTHYYPGLESDGYESLNLYQHFWLASDERNAILFMSYYFFTHNFAYLFLPVSILGFFLFKGERKVMLFIFLVFLIQVLFYGRAYGGYGFGRATLQASVLRYMLPTYALLPIGFACILKNIFKPNLGRRFIPALLTLYILSSLLFAIVYPDYGLYMFEEYRGDRMEIQNKIDSIIDPESVIITDQVCLVPSTSHHKNIIYYPDIPENIRISELERVLEMILEDNDVYFVAAMYDNSKLTPENRLVLNYLKKNFEILQRGDINYIEIYEIKKHTPAAPTRG